MSNSLNQIFKKVRNAFIRIKNGFQVAIKPDELVIYPKEPYRFHNLSFSQEGEDVILSKFFGGKNRGFYVDVGAYHPQRFSNTHYFYLKGWRGINIDAMPGSMKIFEKFRPEDINIELAVSDNSQMLTYYEFNEPAMNGFSSEISNERNLRGQCKITGKRELSTYTLSQILDKYLPDEQNIDFLNIDVEGFDLKVLNSNNWGKYNPTLVLIEDLNIKSLSEINKSKIALFMYEKNYELYAKTVNTLIFKNTSS